MKRAIVRIGVSVLVLGALVSLTLAGTAPLRRPTCELVLHIGVEGWQRARVISENGGEVAVFTPGSREMCLSPLRYGPYRLHVELRDGTSLWARFYQSDVGARRHVEILLEPAPNGQVRFREVVNRDRPLFTGAVRPCDTSEKRPYTLGWI